MASRLIRFAKGLLKSLLRIFTATVIFIVLLLLLFQHKLIYHPRPYAVPPGERDSALAPLTYTTSAGRQTAFYLPPRSLPLRKLWVLFSGNGSLALDWCNLLNPRPDSRDGYLLIDYPGYGDCEGRPSPRSIEESAEAAYASLAQSLHTTPSTLDGKLNLLCLSIGCATGLNFAVHQPVDRIILLAPFTNLRAMARRMVGWPLCWLLLHNYDNRVRLAELAARPKPPQVTIFHGDHDQTIPIDMGRALAAEYPAMIAFHAVPGAGHNTVAIESWTQVAGIMAQ